MVKIALIGVAAAVLAVWIKAQKTEYGMLIILAGGVLLGAAVLGKLEVIVDELTVIQSYFSGYASYLKLLVKIIGITYLAEISSDLCKDAGAAALGTQIELFGKLSILVLCMPVISSLLETVDFFLGG